MFRPLPTIAALLIALGGAVVIAKPILDSSLLAQNSAPSARQPELSWLKELDLSPQQMQRIQSIRDRYKTPLTTQRQAARQAQQNLRSMMAGDASTSEIREKYRQAQTLHQQMMDTQFSSMLEMREVLTPEQRQKFAQRMERRRDRKMREPNPDKDL